MSSSTVSLVPSNTSIPRIGYGTGTKWYSRDKSNPIDKNLVVAIQEALSIGYHHLDCAEAYGTDVSVCEALRNQSIPRNQLFITSKVYKNIGDVEQALDESLARLGVDYLDLYLIHGPFFDRNKISLEQAWKQMEKL